MVGLTLGIIVSSPAQPLATLEYRINGAGLQVTPAAVGVPKGIAGSVVVWLTGGDAVQALATGAFVEAFLRGPGLPEPRRLIAPVNGPLLFPPLNLVGDYQLDSIRLVDALTGEVRMEGIPAIVPVQVFDEVLVSRVTSRPLSADEIKEKGIAIDEQNFRAVEFEVGFVVDGKTVPVKFPVVAPTFAQSTEIIPAAELDARLAEAEEINQQITGTAELPRELQTARLNIQVKGINFQFVDPGGMPELALQVPPIPALVVIPGNIGFLNQFFSVQIFTENAAPTSSGLSVHNIQAALKLPAGPDQIPSTDYSQPGDDPLRFARLGPDRIVQPIQQILRPGPDGAFGTADDVGRLYPRESGQAEFLVEGLQEGLHVMNIDLTADLDGLAAGTVQIMGKAAGSVLVRNPTFSLAFSHPRTIRAGEPYDAYVTLLNTSPNPANFVQVRLAEASLSGGVLESEEIVELGTIQPGQTATAQYRVRAQRTGAITFSSLTTGSDAVAGRFRLRMGVDERGVALSPDTIGMPDFVNALPPSLVAAANRVLGQALSVATAPQLPPAIKPVARSIITQRVLELAEAGQRLLYHDGTNRVLADLLLDWQGGRKSDPGFAQILHETEAGREFRKALFAEMEAADGLQANDRLADRLPDLTGRGEPWAIFSLDVDEGSVRFGDGIAGRLPATGVQNTTALYRTGFGGQWFVTRSSTNLVFEWTITNTVTEAELSFAVIEPNGTAMLLHWSASNLQAGTCLQHLVGSTLIMVDAGCDGAAESTLVATVTPVTELPPDIIAVVQDETIEAGRPMHPCTPYLPRNYGTVLGVLFSKPMQQAEVNVPANYLLDNGTQAGSVQIQPGGRVVLLNMRRPVGAIRPRTMTVTGVSDPRGNPLMTSSLPVETQLNKGVALRGRVVRADGSPAIGVPVTLTMYDEADTLFGCDSFIVRPSQVLTDEQGYFDIDFVMSGVPYSVSATDTSGLSPEALRLVLESASGDTFNRQKLMDLAASPSAQNTLLQAFAVGALPQAIAQAEGLDRALLRDYVPVGSAREGTEIPLALRFRGRATVQGQVVFSDGSTPAPGVAVNLFPDPDSREQGRGIFADGSGRFAFFGVSLGVFTIQARDPSGLARTIAGTLDQPGQSTNLVVVLSSAVVPRTDLVGRVVEADNVTPHAQARVFVGRYRGSKFGSVVASVQADGAGFWRAAGIPADTYDLVAISFDGKRKGDRLEISAGTGLTNHVTVALQGFGVVVGRVETSTGAPVPNALVAGGQTLVRTDSNGVFRLTGVPTGRRTISAGIERNPASGIDFPRFGNTTVQVVAGLENFAVVRFTPAGSIVGRVLDAAGNPVPDVTVALPDLSGFSYVRADGNGNYRFEGVRLKEWTVSAPAPITANTDVSGIQQTLRDADSTGDELQAAIGEAFAIFTGVNDPLLTGEGEEFNPLTWGFTKVNLTFDGQVAVADIRYLREGAVSGKVLDAQSVPIGARVRLTGIGPRPNGEPGIIIRGERNSDPALGTFEFPGQAFVGDWGVQAASPFYPVVVSTSGRTTSTEPNATNIVLQFPKEQEVNGRLTGVVFNPDGSLAGSNVNVRISFGEDFIVRTDENGFFDTQIGLPALSSNGRAGLTYRLEAVDPATGLRGTATVILLPGVTNAVDIILLDRGALNVTVLQANSTPAAGATVEITRFGFSLGFVEAERFEGTNDVNGSILFHNLFEGTYAVSTEWVSGPTTLSSRASAVIFPRQTNTVTLRLGPTGTIRGRFVKRDLTTPVEFAQVAVGDLGLTTTDANGSFEVSGVPIGNYRLMSQDPVTGVGAVLNVRLAFDTEVREVLLVEQSRGEVIGFVVNSYGDSFVPGAQVALRVLDGFTPARTVSTGPDGAFSFPGTPAGPFQLSGLDPVSQRRGTASGTLPENATMVSLNVNLEPLARLAGTIWRPDGITPASNATVRLSRGSFAVTADTDPAGRVSFVDLPLGNYTVRATSMNLEESRSVAQKILSLTAAGAAADFSLTLLGVGSVRGTVFGSDGITPVPTAEVRLTGQSPLLMTVETTLADGFGEYHFDNVAVGPYRISAAAQALGASMNGEISTNAETDVVDLILSSSGTVQGRLVRADGSNAVSEVDVLLTFASQSLLPGRAFVRTGIDGRFSLQNIPTGPFDLEAIASDFGGIARLTSMLIDNGGTNDLGDILMDEDDPRVLQVIPAPTATGVGIDVVVELIFSEPLAATSVKQTGIFLRSATNSVPASLQLLDDPTHGPASRVRLTPHAPLLSERTYEVVVIDGNRLNAQGAVIGSGPRDRVNRPLPIPFLSTFTTADQDPPDLVSVFPTNGQVQIDPRAVPRLTFNEPIRNTGFFIGLTGPGGAVAGTGQDGLNGLILTFTPSAFLDPNTTYTLTVSNVFDLAGNRAAGEPFVSTFKTLDTVGPDILSLQIVDGRSPVARGRVPVEAVLMGNEIGATIRFSQDFQPLGSVSGPPFIKRVTLPASGSTTLIAIATDRFGNDGPLAELVLDVVPNQPPVLSFVRLMPPSGPLTNNQLFTLQVEALDDLEVTNVTVTSVGAISFSTNLHDGSLRALQFVVPPQAVPGGLLEFRARATDGLGAQSAEEVLSFELLDTQPPGLTILSPADDALVDPAQPFELLIASSDNDTNHQIEVMLSGAVTATQTLAVAAAPNNGVTNTFIFSLIGAPTDGSTLSVAVRGTDNAPNTSLLRRSFVLPDTRAPRLVSAVPTNNAVQQSLWATPLFSFDEPLDPASLTNSVTVTNSLGLVIPFNVTLLNGNRQLRVTLERPLQPAESYTTLLFPTLTDHSSNGWLNLEDLPVPASGALFQFTTAALFDSSPTNGTPVIAGQDLTVQANYQAGLGATLFRFSLNSNAPVQVVAGPTSTAAILNIPTNATEVTIHISASPNGSFAEPLLLPSITLNVMPLAGDVDGDGLPNSYEIAHGLNPFANDTGADPDGDGLTNAEEFQRGTHPQLADTDNDQLSDSQELALGTDPLNPDTDGDGLLDGLDPNPLVVGTGLNFVAASETMVTEGETTNLVVQAISDLAPMVVLDFSPTNPVPHFATLGRVTFANSTTNGSAMATLRLAPVPGDAGMHTLVLRGAAGDGSSGTHTLVVTVAPNGTLSVTRWAEPVNGNWDDATRWTDGVPDATTYGVVEVAGTYTVTVNVDATAAGLIMGAETGSQALALPSRILTLNRSSLLRSNATLTLSGGTVNGTGQFLVAGTFNWTSGSLAAGGRLLLAAGSTSSWTTTSLKFVDRVVENAGLVNYDGRNVRFNLQAANQDARIDNLVAGQFVVDGDGDFTHNFSGTNNVFNNAGTFTKRGTNTTTEFSSLVPFHNTGTVNLENGTLELHGGGTQSGLFTRDNGQMRFEDTSYTLTAAAVFNEVVVQAANATLAVPVSRSFQHLSLSNSRLEGEGDVTVTGTFNWTSGSLAAGGRLLLAAGSTSSWTTTSLKFVDRVVENAGLVNYDGRNVRFNGQAANQDARIDNLVAGQFVVDGEGDFTHNFNGTNNVFNNAGAFTKRGTNTTTEFSSLVPFNNTGTVNLENGTLELHGGGTQSGIFTRSDGQMRFEDTSYSLTAAAVFNEVVVEAVNATLVVPISRSFQNLFLSNSRLEGDGDVTVTGTFNWTSGSLAAGGRLVLAAGSTSSWTTTSLKFVDRVVENAGLVNYDGRNVRFNGQAANQDARIDNLVAGQFVVDGEGDFTHNFSGTNNVFNNAGAFTKRGTNTTTEFSSLVPFNNTGTVNLENGTLELQGGGTHSGMWTLAAGSVMELNGQPHTFQTGTSFSDGGTVDIQGPIVLAANLDFGSLQVIFRTSASISGGFAIANTAGGTITVSKTMTFPGSLNIAGTLNISSASFTVTAVGIFTLQATGLLENPGTMIVGGFINNGGTINGNTPQLAGGGGESALLLITGLDIQGAMASSKPGDLQVDRILVLHWAGPRDRTYTVQWSEDLIQWWPVPSVVEETSPGIFIGRFVLSTEVQRFFRVFTR